MPSRRQRLKKKAASAAGVAAEAEVCAEELQNAIDAPGVCTEGEMLSMAEARCRRSTGKEQDAAEKLVCGGHDAGEVSELKSLTTPAGVLNMQMPVAADGNQHKKGVSHHSVELAVVQLLKENNLSCIPDEWNGPHVMPLLVEVVKARAQKIERARSQRAKRREHRKMKK